MAVGAGAVVDTLPEGGSMDLLGSFASGGCVELVGTALDAGSGVKLPTGTVCVGFCDTLGWRMVVGDPAGPAKKLGVDVDTGEKSGVAFSEGVKVPLVGTLVDEGATDTIGSLLKAYVTVGAGDTASVAGVGRSL